jgi:hypothetical protein
MYSVKMSRVIDQCCQTEESNGSDQDSHVHQPVILLDIVRFEKRSARSLAFSASEHRSQPNPSARVM